MDKCIGVITSEGIVKIGVKGIIYTDIEVFEFRLTEATLHLCAMGWKKAVGEDRVEYLWAILTDHSP